MPTLPPSARHDLTDAEWGLLSPLLPVASGRGRPHTWDLRSLINGIFFRIRTGCPWRDVHERYGPWWRIYDLFARLQADGVWASVHTGLLSHAHHVGTLSWEVSVDSTTARGHVHAAGARKDSPARHPGEPAGHGFGRSRGGWSTKIHAAIDSDCGVMAFLITPGQAGDGPQMVSVLEKIRVPVVGRGRPRQRPEHVLAEVLLQRANLGYTRLENRSTQRSEGPRNGLKTRVCNSTVRGHLPQRCSDISPDGAPLSVDRYLLP